MSIISLYHDRLSCSTCIVFHIALKTPCLQGKSFADHKLKIYCKHFKLKTKHERKTEEELFGSILPLNLNLSS